LRANPANYELVALGTLQKVLALFADYPGSWLPIAGGTDVMVLYAAGKLPTRKLVNIRDLRELRRIEVTSSEVRIGAGCTYTDLRQHPIVAHVVGPGRCMDGWNRKSEPRHIGRQHCERVARRRFSPRVAGL